MSFKTPHQHLYFWNDRFLGEWLQESDLPLILIDLVEKLHRLGCTGCTPPFVFLLLSFNWRSTHLYKTGSNVFFSDGIYKSIGVSFN